MTTVDPMRLVFWAGAIWLGYVYIGYPLFLGIVALFRRVRPAARNTYLPSVSVLVAAHNEERDIGWKVTETLAWDYPADRLEILIASDASRDRTEEIVRGIHDPRVTLVRMETRGGKNRALNRLVQLARGDLLFFTDANAHVAPGSLRRIVRHFADARVGCITGDSHAVREANRPAVGRGAGLYWGYEALIKRLENLIGSVLVCDGAIFCIRRSLYSPVLPELANDLELPMRIARAGYWILHEPGAQVVEKDTSSPSEELARRRRISAQGLLAIWKLRHTLHGVRGWQFVSHKLLRWLTPIPLLFVLVSSAWLASQPLFAALLGLQGLFYASALTGLVMASGGRSCSALFAVPFYVLLGSIGTLLGVADCCLGKRFDVWEIPSLSRGSDTAAWQRARYMGERAGER